MHPAVKSLFFLTSQLFHDRFRDDLKGIKNGSQGFKLHKE